MSSIDSSQIALSYNSEVIYVNLTLFYLQNYKK